ncbi:MAG TPA: endonuclease/exonuclease/phosphatase family protein [Saprospiraceae bacterium]|nr:endonuclease/exonuclease/phosphatase family protein [Saprospiraceae bacterium]
MIHISGKFQLCALALMLGCTLSAQTLTCMTYNIRLEVASDGDNAWEHRRDYLSDQIRFYEPDILGIQEGLPQQVAFLQQKLSDYASEGTGREGQGRGESTHVFYKKDRFRQVKAQTFWLSATPDTVSMGWDAACLRVCTAILLQDIRSGQHFWIFNTHLDHMGEIARKNGVLLILDKIKKLNAQGHPVVLMGDFNALPESEVIQLVKKELDDTQALSMSKPFGPEGTFNAFKFQEPVLKRIDYIFVSRSNHWKIRKHAVLSDSKNLHYPSDHLPVWTELHYQKTNKR